MKNIFPTAVNPPKLVTSYGPTLGYIATGILIVFALIHLFRIDTLIPIIDTALPNDLTFASMFVILVILAEVFAIPFLLRMKLSPLAHIVSGFLAILAPLLWTLLAIWTLGASTPTGQLGEFLTLPSSILLVTLNLMWLIFNFITIWSLGYNNLKVKDIAPKAKKKSSTKK